jgi:ABC-2 type transport system permease protein
MVISLVADSIAGERERHTLETLLASRVKDQAILLGKILASVLYGWGLYIISLLVAAVTVNATNGGQPWHFYPLGFFAAAAALSLLSCVLICSVGVFVSLRASTARIAQQRLSLFMMALVFIPVILLQFLPKSSLSVIEFALDALDLQKVMWIGGIILVVLDSIFIFAALARFKRTRLILE